MSKQALIIIDVQNDYFSGGAYPLWNPEAVLQTTLTAVKKAQDKGIPVVVVQHIADPAAGISPFFNEGTDGTAVHPQLAEAVGDAPVVVKRFADSFEQTDLQAVLQKHDVDELVLCGMMTQNCVTHTALSKQADAYECTVLVDACTTVDEMLHNIALHALSTRVALKPVEAF